MIEKLGIRIVNFFIEEGILRENERNIYNYCFSCIIEIFINLMSVLFISILLQKVIESLIFMLIFIPLRSTAGGFHCSTSTRCYVLSISIYISVILLYPYITFVSIYAIVGICAINLLIVMLLSPVESSNKPLTNKSRIVNRILSIIIMFISIGIIFVFYVVDSVYLYIVVLCVTVSNISLIAGYIDNKKHHS